MGKENNPNSEGMMSATNDWLVAKYVTSRINILRSEEDEVRDYKRTILAWYSSLL